MALPAPQRAELAIALVSSLADELAAPEEIERAWEQEAERRLAEARENPSLLIPGEVVRARMRAVVMGGVDRVETPEQALRTLINTTSDWDSEDRKGLLRALVTSVNAGAVTPSDEEWTRSWTGEVERQMRELRDGIEPQPPVNGPFARLWALAGLL